jgi:esterase/lipase
MMKIYAISGLGSDDRVFTRLQKHIDFEVIAWKNPLPKEPLSDYAKRMAEEIDDPNPFILMGLSFGGVVAQEICQFLKPEKLILLSSLRHQDELQPLIKLVKNLGIVEHVPLPVLRPPFLLAKYYFGAEDTEMLKGLIADMDLELVKWSIIALLNWKAKPVEVETIRIHGTADRLLYHQEDAIPVEDGHHMMVHDMAEEVGELLKSALQ